MAKPRDGSSASWASLPHKTQLFVLAICRFAEPLSNTSILSYLYYMLKSFDPDQSPAEIARKAGYLSTAFPLGQFITGTLWGSLSDRVGRKAILMSGLTGTMLSTVMFGFATNVYWLIAARFFSGLMNGNIGVLRTMIGEIVTERRHQARAFLILPMCFNIGSVIGPMLGGFLAEPMGEDSPLRRLFGPGSLIGGQAGVAWMQAYPYALPNVVNAFFICSSLTFCWLSLDETLPELAGKRDVGRSVGRGIVRGFWRLTGGRVPQDSHAYVTLDTLPDTPNPESHRESQDSRRMSGETCTDRRESLTPLAAASIGNAEADEAGTSTGRGLPETANLRASLAEDSKEGGSATAEPKRKMKLREIFTTNVVLTLISFMLCPLHVALWPLFLSTPKSQDPVSLPFRFSGGLGLSTQMVGYAMSILGGLGICLQIFVFPLVNGRYGTLRCYRASLFLFPISYTLIPYLGVLPSTQRAVAAGAVVWSGIVGILLAQVVARTFALPSTVILLNNASPSRKCLGTIHGVGSSLASLARVVGPLTGAFLFSLGQDRHVVGLVWWVLAVVALGGAVFSLFIREGGGDETPSGKAEDERPLVIK